MRNDLPNHLTPPGQPAPFQSLYDWMRSIVMVFLPVVFLLTFVGQTMAVQMDSMTPTLLDGDRMIVSNLLYTPRQGDVIIFSRHDFQDGAALVKRIIALEGDVVDIDTQTGLVYVNGQALVEPYTNSPTNLAGDISYPHIVPPGHVFVIGDNRNHSQDSRHSDIGPVDKREVLGRVIAVITPFGRAGFLPRP